MVGRLTLDQVVKVRVLVPQLRESPGNWAFFLFSLCPFGLVTTDNEALGVFAYAKRDWRGDIILQDSANL